MFRPCRGWDDVASIREESLAINDNSLARLPSLAVVSRAIAMSFIGAGCDLGVISILA